MDFGGRIGSPETSWLGRPASNWFLARGIDRERRGWIHGWISRSAPLFPVLAMSGVTTEFMNWLIEFAASEDEGTGGAMAGAERLSADAIPRRINLGTVVCATVGEPGGVPGATVDEPAVEHFLSIGSGIDRAVDGGDRSKNGRSGRGEPSRWEPMQSVRERMVRAAVLRSEGKSMGSG
jgi:hypothetical protein